MSGNDPRHRFAKRGDFTPIVRPDADPRNADWTKMNWPLPRYKSAEFYDWLAANGLTLAQFRVLPVYVFGVARGLIKDDVWVGDDVEIGPWPFDDEGETEQ